MKDGKSIAIVPGSFDPITYGHIDIVRRAAERYDRVYLAVMINEQKQYTFSLDERARIAALAVKGIDGVKVVTSRGMLWKLAEELCADAIVKGYRNKTDYDYEMKMAEFNTAHNPNAKTVLLEAKAELDKLSSTLVRQRIDSGLSISKYLPKEAEDEIYAILKSRQK